MNTEVTLSINDIDIPIAPVEFEYGISSGETTQIATISPSTTAVGSTKGLTYVYRDLGEKYIELTFNIRTGDDSWRLKYGGHMKTDTDSIDYSHKTDITNPQEFIDWMLYAHGSGEPLKITIKKRTNHTRDQYYTHTLTGTYKVSHTSISSSADRLHHYATFTLGLVRYMPPVTEKVKLVRLLGDTDDVFVESTAVESYEQVRTAGGLRARNFRDSHSDILRRHVELEPMNNEVTDDEETEGYFKQLTDATIARVLTSVGKDSSRLLREVFIENPIGLFNRENPLAPLKVLGSGFGRLFQRGANILLDGMYVGLATAAGMVNPVLQLGVEATFKLAGGLISKIPFPSFGSEALDASAELGASAETPLIGDGGIVLSYDMNLGFDPVLHATGFDPDTITPVYRKLKPGIYKKE